MNVSLTPELEKFVQSEVACGVYQSASEVVLAGLRCLMEAREGRQIKRPTTREELEAELIQSIDQLVCGKGVESEEAFQRLAERIKESRSNG